MKQFGVQRNCSPLRDIMSKSTNRTGVNLLHHTNQGQNTYKIPVLYHFLALCPMQDNLAFQVSPLLSRIIFQNSSATQFGGFLKCLGMLTRLGKQQSFIQGSVKDLGWSDCFAQQKSQSRQTVRNLGKIWNANDSPSDFQPHSSSS